MIGIPLREVDAMLCPPHVFLYMEEEHSFIYVHSKHILPDGVYFYFVHTERDDGQYEVTEYIVDKGETVLFYDHKEPSLN